LIEECKIGFRREDSRIDAREGGGDLDGGINVLITWNSYMTGKPANHTVREANRRAVSIM